MPILETRQHPVYSGQALSWNERFQPGRRYGKYDFGRFEHLNVESHFLGTRKIGDVEVACKFLFRESRWGVLTPEKNPGGIVYLDLTFSEPLGCRLKNAVISLTLDEKDEDLQRYGNSPAKVPVHIVEHGPQILHGELDSAFKVTKHSLSPHFDVGGIAGAGGIGRDSTKYYTHQSRWKFSSSLKPNRQAIPTTLKWRLRESDLNSQLRDDNTFRTAFVFAHDGQPFFMRVQVSGCLEGIGADLQHKVTRTFRKLKFPVKPQFATTMIDFGGRENIYQERLDEPARNIPLEMIKKNAKLVAQVPKNSSGASLPYEVLEGEKLHDRQENTLFNYNPPPPPPPPPPTIRYDSSPSEAVIVQKIKRETLVLLSSKGPLLKELEPVDLLEAPLPTDNHRPESLLRQPSPPTGKVETSVNRDTLLTQEQDKAIRDVPVIRPHIEHEELKRIVKDTPLPTVFQVIILWVLAVGLRWSSPPRKNIQASVEKG
ncbi:hypothetical protein K445DRAFT_303611 [Daldinia sp. EC12]|nr:hypothetical protein K445DRAFT_303611 [Daldinia sp. EC12]